MTTQKRKPALYRVRFAAQIHSYVDVRAARPDEAIIAADPADATFDGADEPTVMNVSKIDDGDDK